MKQAKVHLEHAVELNGKLYIGGQMTHRSEKKFIKDADENGVVSLPSDTIYRVSKVTDPEDSATLYGSIEPLDGFDNYRGFIMDNIDIVKECILNKKMIFPAMMANMPSTYRVQLCGTPLVNRVIANKEVACYVLEHKITPGIVFDKDFVKKNSSASIAAIRKDIKVIGKTQVLSDAVQTNIAAIIRYRILLIHFSEYGGSVDAMVAAYNIANSLRDAVLRVREACLGSDPVRENIRKLADSAYSKLCSDCKSVCFADNNSPWVPPCVKPHGAYNYFFLEPERITPEAIDAVNAVVAAFGETFRFSSKKVKVIADEKKRTTEKIKKPSKKDTKKKETVTAKEEKKGENENGKEEK